MLSRRLFIASAVATTRLAPPAHAADAAKLPRVLVIYDPHNDAAQRFARAARHTGATVVRAAGDRHRLMRALLLSACPDTIVGIGSQSDRLLLAGTAMDQGFRLRGEALHRDDTHDCSGCLAAHAEGLAAAGAAWPDQLAAALLGSRLPAPAAMRQSGQALVSWVATRRSVGAA